MTAVQLNAQNTKLWQNIGAIADSEQLMKRLAKYVAKLVKEREDSTLMSEKELFAKIEKAEDDFRDGRTYAMLPGESFKDFRKRIGK